MAEFNTSNANGAVLQFSLRLAIFLMQLDMRIRVLWTVQSIAIQEIGRAAALLSGPKVGGLFVQCEVAAADSTFQWHVRSLHRRY